MQIQAIAQTNDPTKIATELEVTTRDPTELSIYAVWKLTDVNGAYVNDGSCLLTDDGSDPNNIINDYTKYLSDNSYLYTYVVNLLGLTVVSFNTIV